MSHLTPFLAIAVVTVLVSDRGISTVRAAAGLALTLARGLVEYLRAICRRYARLAFGP